ncbi:MAG: helix-turn-helix domain-containing protein [Acidobacteria bacterium]|nr:helix-turn-helix domain-containing protein [Acidobacteriota bacterium]
MTCSRSSTVRSHPTAPKAQRYQIYACMKADRTHLAIAAEVGVHPSTISRKLTRNRGRRGYRPQQAQQKAQARKMNHGTTRELQFRGWRCRMLFLSW